MTTLETLKNKIQEVEYQNEIGSDTRSDLI